MVSSRVRWHISGLARLASSDASDMSSCNYGSEYLACSYDACAISSMFVTRDHCCTKALSGDLLCCSLFSSCGVCCSGGDIGFVADSCRWIPVSSKSVSNPGTNAVLGSGNHTLPLGDPRHGRSPRQTIPLVSSLFLTAVKGPRACTPCSWCYDLPSGQA